MKIAVVTEDEKTISRHFGRAPYYVVCTVENDVIVAREVREKTHHQQHGTPVHIEGPDEHHEHGPGDHHNHDHGSMLAPLADCAALLARGMGHGAYNALQAAHIEAVITDIPDIDDAVRAYAQGNIANHLQKLH